MIKRIEKSKAEGIVNAPSSKSVAHRMLICAAMCQGESRIEAVPCCDDVLATIDCLRALGVSIDYDGHTASVVGIDFTKAKPSCELNCRESGSTLRFLIPLAMLSGNEIVFTGSERLMARPQNIYEAIAKEWGLTFKRERDRITVKGPLSGGEYFIDGNVSSQFITGMLLALSALNADAKIIFNTPIESRPYVDLTISVMAKFGVRVYFDTDWSFLIFGGQEYRKLDARVEGDWSSAAFIDALNHIGGRVQIDGLNEDSLQGDRVFREYFRVLNEGFAVVDIANFPDLGPILFTMAAIKNGGKFIGTKRLRDKESDRIEAMQKELSKFGAEFIADENSVTVVKKELHTPSERLCSHNDHRIAMSLAVLCTLFGGEIEGCEAVSKSYPDFFKDIHELGIKTIPRRK